MLCLHKLASSCEKRRRKYLYPSGNFFERHCLLLREMQTRGKSRRNTFRSHCNPNCLANIGLKAIIQRAAVNKSTFFLFARLISTKTHLYNWRQPPLWLSNCQVSEPVRSWAIACCSSATIRNSMENLRPFNWIATANRLIDWALGTGLSDIGRLQGSTVCIQSTMVSKGKVLASNWATLLTAAPCSRTAKVVERSRKHFQIDCVLSYHCFGRFSLVDFCFLVQSFLRPSTATDNASAVQQ